MADDFERRTATGGGDFERDEATGTTDVETSGTTEIVPGADEATERPLEGDAESSAGAGTSADDPSQVG